MLILPKKEEQDEEKDNVVQLKPITGGKDPTHNWLRECPEGQWFSCKPRNSRGFGLFEFCVIYHTPSGKGTYLGTRLKEIGRDLVLNKEFSRDMELVEYLPEGIDG